jgi:hypothetical protein
MCRVAEHDIGSAKGWEFRGNSPPIPGRRSRENPRSIGDPDYVGRSLPGGGWGGLKPGGRGCGFSAGSGSGGRNPGGKGCGLRAGSGGSALILPAPPPLVLHNRPIPIPAATPATAIPTRTTIDSAGFSPLSGPEYGHPPPPGAVPEKLWRPALAPANAVVGMPPEGPFCWVKGTVNRKTINAPIAVRTAARRHTPMETTRIPPGFASERGVMRFPWLMAAGIKSFPEEVGARARPPSHTPKVATAVKLTSEITVTSFEPSLATKSSSSPESQAIPIGSDPTVTVMFAPLVGP